MNKRLVQALIAGVIGIILFQSISIYKLRKSVDENNTINTSNFFNISSNIDNLNSNIQETINEELSKTHLVKNVYFKLNSTESETYKLDLRAELRRASEDSSVIFMYKKINEDDWQQIELQKANELSYTGKIELDFDGEYEYKIVTKGTLSESGDIESINKYEFIPESSSVGFGRDYERKEISLYLSEFNGQNDVKIKNVNCIVIINGEEKIYEFKYIKNANFQGEEDMESATYMESGTYEVYIPKEDSNGNIESAKVVVTYENGFKDYIDITEELKSEYQIGWDN